MFFERLLQRSSGAVLARPSTVVISAPSACTASIKQERTGAPLCCTVQLPHTPCSQPTCVPVRANSWRRNRRDSAGLDFSFNRLAVDDQFIFCKSFSVSTCQDLPLFEKRGSGRFSEFPQLYHSRNLPCSPFQGGKFSRHPRFAARNLSSVAQFALFATLHSTLAASRHLPATADRLRWRECRSPDRSRRRFRAATLLNKSGARLLADEHFFDPALTPRFVADARQSNARVGNLLLVAHQQDRDADDGEIAEPSRELDKRRAGPCRLLGNRRFQHHLVAGKRRGQVGLKKSRAAISRLAVRLPTVTEPSSASSTAGNSAAGSACARLPHNVPRLRVCS